MLILGQKEANLDQKRSKMGVAGFIPDFKPLFFKVDHKIGFYTKYQQNSMDRLVDISQNVDFGPKRGQIWTKKGPKWTGLDFSRIVNINFPKEDHKISFYTKNQQNSMNPLEDISQNVDFGPKRGKF